MVSPAKRKKEPMKNHDQQMATEAEDRWCGACGLAYDDDGTHDCDLDPRNIPADWSTDELRAYLGQTVVWTSPSGDSISGVVYDVWNYRLLMIDTGRATSLLRPDQVALVPSG